MGREIIDTEVRAALLDLGLEKSINDLLEMYGSTVNTKLVTTTVESAGYEMVPCKKFARLKEEVEKGKDSNEECVVRVGTRDVPVRPLDLAVVKGLALEQISNSQEYSTVISKVLLQFLAQIVKGREVLTFIEDDNWNDFGKGVFRLAVKEVLDITGYKLKEEVTVE